MASMTTARAVEFVDALPRCSAPGCDMPGVLAGARYPQLRFCGQPHRGAHEPHGQTCLQCNTRFAPKLHGRKPRYCSQTCRNARRSELRLAMKELAERRGPASLEECRIMWGRAQLLAGFLAAAAGDWRLLHAAHGVIRTHWQGSVPRPIRQVEPALVKAAFAYAGSLWRLLDDDTQGRLRHGDDLADVWARLLKVQDEQRRSDAGTIETAEDGSVLASPYGAARRTRVDPVQVEAEAVAGAGEIVEVGAVEEESDGQDT